MSTVGLHIDADLRREHRQLMDGFGPNDGQVLRFLAAVSRLTMDQARELARLRAAADPDALAQANRLAERAALMAERSEALESARDAIRVWRRFRIGTPWFGRAIRVYWRRLPRGHHETMAAATPALLDTITALVVRDIVELGTFQVLHGSWAAVQHLPAPGTPPA